MQVFQHCSFILLFWLFWALASPHDFEDSFSISIQKNCCNFSGATLIGCLVDLGICHFTGILVFPIEVSGFCQQWAMVSVQSPHLDCLS